MKKRTQDHCIVHITGITVTLFFKPQGICLLIRQILNMQTCWWQRPNSWVTV